MIVEEIDSGRFIRRRVSCNSAADISAHTVQVMSVFLTCGSVSFAGRADMVMASFSITSPRSAVIDYSAPYYHSGFALVSITRPDVTTNLLSFMEPFPMLVWPAIMGVCVITFLCQVCCHLVSVDDT